MHGTRWLTGWWIGIADYARHERFWQSMSVWVKKARMGVFLHEAEGKYRFLSRVG